MSTTDDNVTALTQRVAALERTVGDPNVKIAFEDLAKLTKENELPNGEYQLLVRQRQLGFAIDGCVKLVNAFAEELVALRQDVEALKARPAGSASSSSSVIPLIAPAGTVAKQYVREDAAPKLAAGQESQLEVVGAQVFDQPVAFLAPIGIGGAPVRGVPATIRKGGALAWLVNQREADTQEFRTGTGTGDRLRAGMMYMEPYDRGMRIHQGGIWSEGKYYRVDDETATIALDGAGKFSLGSTKYVRGEDGRIMTERGQDVVIESDDEWITISVRPGGKGLRVGCNTNTGHRNELGLNDRMVELVRPIEQRVQVPDMPGL